MNNVKDFIFGNYFSLKDEDIFIKIRANIIDMIN